MSDDGQDSNIQNEETFYAYVHILPSKTGDAYRREIVSTDAIRKFDFDAYNKQKQAYKKKKFKIQFGPEGNTHKCFVLFAAS